MADLPLQSPQHSVDANRNPIREPNLYLTILTTAEQLSLSAPTVAKALQHMVKLGMVRETTGKQRHRLFTYHRYLEILNRGIELPKVNH